MIITKYIINGFENTNMDVFSCIKEIYYCNICIGDL